MTGPRVFNAPGPRTFRFAFAPFQMCKACKNLHLRLANLKVRGPGQRILG